MSKEKWVHYLCYCKSCGSDNILPEFVWLASNAIACNQVKLTCNNCGYIRIEKFDGELVAEFLPRNKG